MNRNLQKTLPIVLSVMGSIGVIATAVLTAKSTSKYEEDMYLCDVEEMDRKEEITVKIKIAVKDYAPAISIGIITIACIVGSNVINSKQQASLIAAYGLVQKTHKQYRRKVMELFGEEADKKIEEEIAVDKADEVSIYGDFLATRASRLPSVRSEPMLFYDAFSKRFFEAPLEQVLDAEYHLNRNYLIFGFETVNEFYEMLGIPGIERGDDLCWEPLDFENMWIDFDHEEKVLKDGRKYISISMMCEPVTTPLLMQ